MDNDEIDLLALWNTLWRRKWSIMTLVFIVMLLTTLVVMSITPIYRAASTLLIEQKGARVLSIEQVYGVDGSGNEYLQTQFELLKSRALAERVVRRLNLHTHYEFDPAQQEPPLVDIRGMLKNFDINQFIPGLLPEDLEEPIPASEDEIIERVTRAFMERITISPVGRSQLVLINVDMADRFTAAAAANALAEGFIDGQLDASMEMTLSATTWMNSRLSELRANLQSAEDRLQAFRDAEGIVDVGGILTVTASELSATSDRMIDARRNRAEAESEFRQVQAMRSGGWERLASIPAVLSNPLIQTFKAEEARARARVEELSGRYGARHPVMEAAQSDLNAARASLRTQVEQIVAGIERNYQLAVANEQSLRRSVEENKEQIQDISRKEFQLRELQREVDANRTLYDTFMTRLKETTATSDLETANARIVIVQWFQNIQSNPVSLL
ncbi:tyrosine kinase [Nitrincola nitratireducens]|uniref:Tyrosine kinase n=2 Tax=Nitrincola nitratireducens TaxID=1229521 RepID=W9UUM7_9GAMM|nr:tyrosine kinase [Nitrincola nitratireducens]